MAITQHAVDDMICHESHVTLQTKQLQSPVQSPAAILHHDMRSRRLTTFTALSKHISQTVSKGTILSLAISVRLSNYVCNQWEFDKDI